MAPAAGFEPATKWLTGCGLYQFYAQSHSAIILATTSRIYVIFHVFSRQKVGKRWEKFWSNQSFFEILSGDMEGFFHFISDHC